MIAGRLRARLQAGAVLGEAGGAVVAACRRFPVPVAAFGLLTLYFNGRIVAGDGIFAEASVMRVAAALGAAALAAVALSLAAEGWRTGRVAGALLALTGAVLAGVAVWWDEPLKLRYVPFFAALLLGPLVAPYLRAGVSGAAFWLYGARLTFALLLGLVLVGVVGGGLSAIFASLAFLFGLPIPGDAYAHVWTIVLLFLGPVFVLSRIPDRFDVEPVVSGELFGYAGVRALSDYAAAPLLVVYTLVLHAYALKIAITGTWPEGQVGWIVLAYGLSILTIMFLVGPFRVDQRAASGLVLTWWPLFMPVPLILLALALRLRIAEYGMTPRRYDLALFAAAFAVAVVLQAIPRLRGDLRPIAILAVAALLATSLGPTGGLWRSLDQQTARFLALAADAPRSNEANRQAVAALQFLSQHDALDRVAPADLPATSGADGDLPLFTRIAAAYGLDTSRVQTAPMRTKYVQFMPAGIPLTGFDRYLPTVNLTAQRSGEAARNPDQAHAELTVRLEERTLEVTRGSTVARFPLDALIEAADRRDGSGPLPAVGIPLDDGMRRILLMPTVVELALAARPTVRSLTTAIAYRAADWPAPPVTPPATP